MKTSIFNPVPAFLVLSISLFGSSPAVSETQKITIGGSSSVGVYTAAAKGLCRVMARYSKDLICTSQTSRGSVANLNDLNKGVIDFGMAQSDAHFSAYTGYGKFKDGGGIKKLRSVFSMHPEAFTIVARADANITKLDDLVGKRVNIGNPGSGQRGTMETVMEAKGWTKDTFSGVEELPSNQHSLALCHNKVQAIVYSTGHPDASVGKAIGLCQATVVSVNDAAIQKLTESKPYYANFTVPGGVYEGVDDVESFGVFATLVTTDTASSDMVYSFVKTIFENLNDLKRAHPAFAYLEPKDMIKTGLTAPLHEGAVRYYKEKGWM
jgi:hypothetical protein